MIQILGIRTWFDPKDNKEKKKDAFFEKNWRAPSIHDLLTNFHQYLEQVPEADRYNIFFTQANCGVKKREFHEQWVLPFDIDGIDPEKRDAYISVFGEFFEMDTQDLYIIFSGHGLQIAILLNEPFKDIKFFEEMRQHYYTICDKINHKLASRGLPGHMDRGFWKPHIFFRLPGTENRKPNLPPVEVELVWAPLVPKPRTLDLKKYSGLPVVDPKDQLPVKQLFATDKKGVLSGCDFLKFCKENPDKINEPQWYAMLSVVGRLQDGVNLAHEYSQGHKGYSVDETEIKLAQALQASGPRTCKNIEGLWDGCKTCPYYEKISSPVSIKGKDFIETEGSGFHKIHIDKKGNPVVGKPAFDDLRRFFETRHPYRVMGKSGICYVWKGSHYEIMDDLYLENFAQENFNPKALTFMTHEFQFLICRTNLTPPNFFTRSTEKMINFKNGVLDLETGDLSPHTMDRGFRYVLPYNYDEEAKCPHFDRFLYQVTGGDDDLADLLMEFAGYAFSGDRPWSGKVLVLTGEGSNGKSTFIDVLRALAGPDNYSSLTWKAMNNPVSLQLLDGKLFNLAEETPKHALNDSTLFKDLATGGEITVRTLYKQPYPIRNKAKLIFACNELPQSEDTTKGYFRRFLIAPFKVEFSDEKGNVDTHILDKLLSELPGIFNLVMKGYKRLTKNKRFTKAGSVDRELENYRLDIDHATRWIQENLEVLPLNGGEKCAIIGEVYQNYRNEMLNTGEDPVTAVHFGKKLSKLIPEYSSRAKIKKVSQKAHRVLVDVTYRTLDEM